MSEPQNIDQFVAIIIGAGVGLIIGFCLCGGALVILRTVIGG